MVDKPVEKNKDYVLKIDALGSQGEGIGRINNFAIFVNGALPGEEIRAKIVKLNKNYGYGKLVEILKPSDERVKPLCSLKRCGGCQLLHLSYDAQLKFKKQKVSDSIERIAKLKDALIHDTIGMKNPYRYRNKAQFPVGIKDGRPIVGFYAPRSHEVVDTPSCLIQDEMSDKIMEIIREWARAYGISIYDEGSRKGILRHVMVRKAYHTGDIMVVIVTSGFDMPHREELISVLKENIPNLKSVIQNINQEATNVVLGSVNNTIYGTGDILDYIGDLKFQISPMSFFQVNPVQTEVLYSKALEYANLSGDETVIDAYCGTGTISLFLAQKAKKVYGVEVIKQAIIDARDNAVRNKIENVEFIEGRAEDVISKLYKNGVKADVVVVDPPRKGCKEELLQTIASMKPERVVYVSCDPATLARDLKYLSENGFKVVEVQPVDMFPFTYHVECVVLMSRVEG